MLLSELINKAQEIKEKHGDVEVMIDSEAAQYVVHMVGIDDICPPEGEEVCCPIAYITLDDEVKQHMSDMGREAMVNFFKEKIKNKITDPQTKELGAKAD